MKISLILVSLLASAQAFVVPTPNMVRTNTQQLQLLTEQEAEAIMTHAQECAEGECGLDDVDDLISTLKAQQKELSERVESVREMIQSLEIVNGADDRPVDEIRETVRAIFRVFQLGDSASGNDFPSLSKPTGYSGDVGSGSTTAYDALPPKKWKADK
mmetsp:Transcript_26086/g.61962  ORF Transcript_26086/g.61962 Transcript_26086/m.61962 type:complete len:158 (+) Transcript_26086:168-641(+)